MNIIDLLKVIYLFIQTSLHLLNIDLFHLHAHDEGYLAYSLIKAVIDESEHGVDLRSLFLIDDGP